MKIIEWVKANPLTVAGVIGALIVFYLLFSGGSSGVSTTVVQAGQQDNTMDLAAMQLQAQSQQLQYKLAETQTVSSANVAVAQLQAQLGALQTAAGRDVSLAGIVAQENVQKAGFSSQEILAELQSRTNIASIAAQRDIAAMQAATYGHLAEVQAATTIASYDAQVRLAEVTGMTQVGLANIQAGVETTRAWTDYWKVGEYKKIAQHQSTVGAIGGAVGALASFAF